MKRPKRRPANVVIAEDSSDIITSILSPSLKKAGYNVYSVVPERNWLPKSLGLEPRAVLFNAGRRKRDKARLATELRKKLQDAVMIGILGENQSGGSPDHKHFDHCFAM